MVLNTLKSEKSLPSDREEKKRLNIILSKRNWDRLVSVMDMMEAETITDAVKDAFRLLEYFLKVSKSGGKFFVQMPGEEPKQIEMFGISTD